MTKETRGCWQKEKTLGHGGFGEVTLWNNMETGKHIAIKTLQRRKDGDDRVLERWQTEVEILLRLDHNNVVKGFEVPAELQECDKSSMAMQYCSGGDLRQVISKPENRCGLPESDVRFIARDVSSAIEYLHSMKIIHRDLKPDNVVLQTSADVEGDCERIVYKLIDLGYAKDLDQDSVAKSFVGTWYYLAPELLESDRYTCTVDYWSFGIIMFEMMTGLRPFLQSEKPISKLWQDSVKNKRQEVIHIFFNTQAKVQCSDKIPSPNQLCRITRGYMEQWLRLMLLFEPVKRGGNFTVKKRRECFEFLDQILNIRLIHIFCVPSSKLLSYPLQSSHMPLPEVMTLVERETNIPVARQDLLLGSGMELNRSKLAQQCIVGDVDDTECPVFLFDKGCNAKELQWRPLEIPEWVKRILKEPTTRFTIGDQKRAWYQALNFCRSAARNLKQLQNAQRAALLCLLRNNTNFMKLHQELTTGIVKFQAKLEFFRKSHELDLRRFEEQTESGIFSQRMHQSWKQAEAEVQNCNILEMEKEQLEPKCVSVSTMIYELQKSQPKQMDLLDKLAEEALLFVRQYQNVKQPITHEEIVTIVKKCQRTHEDVSNVLYTCIGKICRCKQEMTQLLPLVEAQVQNIDRASNRLFALQSERQRNVWKLVEVALKVTPLEPSHPDSPGVNGLPMSQLSLSPVVLQRGREESMTAIREHRAVKDEFSSILGSLEESSKTSLDWTFLDTLASQLPEDGVTGNT